MSVKRTNRVGESVLNNFGSKMTIIAYNNANNITVQFENGFIKKTIYNVFKTGEIKSPFCKSVYNIGFLGGEEYLPRIRNTITSQYMFWFNMLNRCHDQKYHKKEPAYMGCTVCEEWHNFQNFAKWHDNNYYNIPGEKMQLDKDILVKDNKIYSPETCVFVPQRINNLFEKRKTSRGATPIGVSFYKRDNNYSAYYVNRGLKKHIGYFLSSDEAFLAYKMEKEKYIKEVADEFKELIPKKLYLSMYNYIVEITD